MMPIRHPRSLTDCHTVAESRQGAADRPDGTDARSRRTLRHPWARVVALAVVLVGIARPGPLLPPPIAFAVDAISGSAIGSTASMAVDPAACLATWQEIEQWVDDWQPPRQTTLPDDVVGAWMGIRWGGRLIGEGIDIRPFEAITQNPSGLQTAASSALPYAFRQAMADAEANLSGPEDEKASVDAIAPGRTALVDAPLTLEVQFAHNAVRLRASTRETLLQQIDPARQGMIVSRGNRFAAAFPGAMLAAEHTPGVALLGLLNQAEIGLAEFVDGLANGTVRVWSFDVVHLAQAEPEGPPAFLSRGTRTVPEHAMSRTSIESFGHELAWNLLNQRAQTTPNPQSPLSGLGVLGPYRNPQGRHDPLLASPATQAIVALALHRYGTLPLATASGIGTQGDRNVSPEEADRRDHVARQQATAREAAIAIMRDLAVIRPEEANPAEGISNPIFFVIADREIPVTFGGDRSLQTQYEDLRRKATEALNRLYDPTLGYQSDMTPIERAAAAYALSTRAAVDLAWRSTDFSVYPSLLPWIGWAEQRVSTSDADLRRAALGLRVLRETIWDRQAVIDAGGTVPTDAAGGIALSVGTASAPERPDWRTARALAFTASMLREPSLTEPAERFPEVANIVRSMRFLRQLSVREADLYRLRDRDKTMGGMRTTLWTDTIHPEATATTLLAVVETLQSLDWLSTQAATGGRDGGEGSSRSTNRRSR